MSIYAVITDQDLEHSPVPRLVATASAPELLQHIRQYDPYGGYSKVVKAGFNFGQMQQIMLVSTINAQQVPAHICEVTAN